MEDLQNKVFLLWAADAHQVGSVLLAEQVSLKPAQPLLLLRGMENLHTGHSIITAKSTIFTVRTETVSLK